MHGIQRADDDADLILESEGDVKNRKFIWTLTFFAAIGGFLFGYDTGVVSGAMLLMADQFNLSDIQQEMIVSFTVAGAIVGSMVGGVANDRFGRRPVIIFSAAVFTGGAVVMAAAEDWTMLLIGRAIVGIAIGFVSMTVPMYLAETAPPSLRGTLTVINNLFITGGQMIAGIIDGCFSEVPQGWRYMLGLAAVPAIIQFVGFLFLPESPRYLVQKGKIKAARQVLVQVRGSENVDRELNAIKESFSQQLTGRCSVWQEVWTKRSLRRALVIGCTLQVIQQLSGINTAMYYSATILKQAGITSNSLAIWLSAVVAGCNFLFTLVGLYLVERAGRRKLLLGSLVGITFCLVLLGISFKIGSDRVTPLGNNLAGCEFSTCSSCISHGGCGYCPYPLEGRAVNTLGSCMAGNATKTPWECSSGWAYNYCPASNAWLAILSLVLYIAFFAPGMGPMPWTINSEICLPFHYLIGLYHTSSDPPQYRGFGNSVATAFNWTGNLIISMTFLDLGKAITEAGAFWLYAGFALAGLVFVYFYVPETRGLSLEQIESVLDPEAARQVAEEKQLLLQQ